MTYPSSKYCLIKYKVHDIFLGNIFLFTIRFNAFESLLLIVFVTERILTVPLLFALSFRFAQSTTY